MAKNWSGICESLIQPKIVVISGIIVITLLAWAYIIWMATMMDAGTPSMALPQSKPWTLPYATTMFIMWAVMMIAMMLPSAAPMILTYANINSGNAQSANSFWLTTLFTSSYLLVWMLFSLVATAAQWALHSASYLSPMMATTDQYIGGAVLIAVAVYQLSPQMNSCLKHCRSPMGYFITNWRDGPSGAFSMGFVHGAYCVGCCWAVMAVLFVTGVMSLLWVAVISLFVLVEKVTPMGEQIARASALIFFTAGLWLMLS